jgi:hypothetical protein
MKFFSAAQRSAVAASLFAVLFSIPTDSAVPAGYKGYPYLDSIQQIPLSGPQALDSFLMRIR